jgi:hypothetical protein
MMSMSPDVRVEPSEEHGIEVHIPAIQSWDGLDTIANFFVEHFDGSILERLDGPDARILHMDVRGESIVLVHDDLLGNRFFAQQSTGEGVVRHLADGLIRALEHGR